MGMRIEPHVEPMEVMYVDRGEGVAVCADKDYNSVEVPLSRIPGKISDGARLNLHMHNDDIVKVVVVSEKANW
eukprot:NODE_8258_length_392_cov_211.534125.p1 GENE.NODE_8258_length_392_cov_211.534125~~NODE_8258_length_392_cov_211.534125.p1  ORF type:complete len:73 (-),score=19.87 NODE_8258_length_392_cov_211.534125:156-374(-)